MKIEVTFLRDVRQIQPDTRAARSTGFTRVDLVAALFAMVLVILIALPLLASTGNGSGLAACLNNLREIGQGLGTWSAERESFSWQMTQREGGTMMKPNAWEHFITLSNQLSSPRVLVCPSDTREPAQDFGKAPGGLAWPSGGENNAVSYFIALDSLFGLSTQLISGDRHVTGGDDYQACRYLGIPVSYSFQRRTPNTLAWTNALHGANSGNLLLNNGSAFSTTTETFRQSFLEGDSDGNINHHVLVPR
jgi:hypothetical protein